VLKDPEDPAKGESPGRRSRGDGTATARWPGASEATLATADGTNRRALSQPVSARGGADPPEARRLAAFGLARLECAHGTHRGNTVRETQGPRPGPEQRSGGENPRRATALEHGGNVGLGTLGPREDQGSEVEEPTRGWARFAVFVELEEPQAPSSRTVRRGNDARASGGHRRRAEVRARLVARAHCLRVVAGAGT
jgi:hypothetical protein